VAYRAHCGEPKWNLQLVCVPSLHCTLQSRHKTSGTLSIAGMLPSVAQASAAREKAKGTQCKEVDQRYNEGQMLVSK